MSLRSIVVTGAASGIGRATALCLAEIGRPVAVWDLRLDACEAVAKECREKGAPAAIAAAVDVRDAKAIETAASRLDELGPLGGFVHAAGVAFPGAIDVVDDASWDHVLEVNLKAFATLCRILVPKIRAAGPGGAIVGVSSVEGFIGHAMVPAYCASKAGLLGAVRSAAHHLAKDGIRVNAICPGAVDTPMMAPLLAMPGYKKNLEKRIPLGRIADPSEIGRTIRFLLSDDASYVTGQHLVADGGMLATG